MQDREPKTLGAKIKALRLERGLTQGSLTHGEITPGLLSQIESDRVTPSVRVITLLAKQLCVSPDELVNEVESRTMQMQLITDARAFLDKGDGASAIPLLKKLLTTSISYVSPKEIALDIAYANELMGQIEYAILRYETLEHEAMIEHDYLLAAKTLQRRGELANKQGEVSLALYCSKKSLSFLQSVEMVEPSLVTNAKKNISIYSYRLGNITQSLQYAEELYAEFQRKGLMENLAELCHMLSVLHVEKGNYDRALQFAKDAVSVYRSLGLRREQIDATLNYAIILREVGNPKKALGLLPNIIADYYQQTRTPALVTAWTERALCEMTLGKIEDAIRSLERSLSLAQPNTTHYAEACRVQGLLLMEKGERATAAMAFEKSLAIATSFRLFATAQNILAQLERLYEQDGQMHKAYACHERKNALMALSHQQLTATFLTV